MAKKAAQQEEIRLGLDQIRSSGIQVDAPSPEIVPRLLEEFGKDKRKDLAIAFLLGRVGDPVSAAALIELEPRARDKDVRKEMRRSLFKLSQRGIAVPERPAERTPPPVIVAEPEIEASMSAVDGSGGRLVWIAKPQPGLGLLVLQAVVSDREGLLRVGGGPMRRKALRRMAQEIAQKHAISMIPVPWEYADEVLYHAYEKAKAAGRAGLEAFPEIRSMINPVKPKAQEHPVYRRIGTRDLREGAWRELSRSLLDEPELRFWILDEDWIRPHLSQIEEAKTSRLVLNPMQKEERLAAIVRDAVRACCTGETGAILARRLEDMALYFLQTGREPAARLALAVALQVREGDPGPLDIAFLTGLVQKSFAFHLSKEKQAGDAEPSLIVKP
ncbi:MAG TPA: hypothetical protein VNM15_05585 [Candidatus Binatia bacterium]|nr:hypothetical protein [Candidatus Binatia bacterium]